MILKELEDKNPPLRYGDRVVVLNEDSKYSGLIGKITGINNTSADVKFEDEKKSIRMLLTGLRRA